MLRIMVFIFCSYCCFIINAFAQINHDTITTEYCQLSEENSQSETTQSVNKSKKELDLWGYPVKKEELDFSSDEELTLDFETSDKKTEIADINFWDNYVLEELYVRNFFASANLYRLFNRKDYNDDDFTYLTLKCRFSKNDNVFISPDGKVIIHFDHVTMEYIKEIQYNIETKEDLSFTGFDETLTYDMLEQGFGYQYYKSLDFTYKIITFVDSDPLINNHLELKFGFRSQNNGVKDFDLMDISFVPLNAKEITLNESGEAGFTKFGCIEGDCENGFGTFQWVDGYVYTGTFSNKRPLEGSVNQFNFVNKRVELYTSFINGETEGGMYPTIFEKIAVTDPLVEILNAAAVELRNIIFTRNSIDYYFEQLQKYPENLETSKNWIISYSEQGIEQSKKCMELTDKAYTILLIAGICKSTQNRLGRIRNALGDIEDIFWVLRHIGILNGSFDQSQANVVNQWDYYMEKINFQPIEYELEDCGYFD